MMIRIKVCRVERILIRGVHGGDTEPHVIADITNTPGQATQTIRLPPDNQTESCLEPTRGPWGKEYLTCTMRLNKLT